MHIDTLQDQSTGSSAWNRRYRKHDNERCATRLNLGIQREVISDIDIRLAMNATVSDMAGMLVTVLIAEQKIE